MKRLKWIPALIIMLALLGGIGYSAVFGLGADKSGSLSSINLGLDLAGGVSITYEVVGDETPDKEDMADTIYKLQQRVDQYSTEAQVYQEGSNRINIEIPGVNDANAILEELGQPGNLYFIKHLDKDGNENYSYHSGILTDENGDFKLDADGNIQMEEGIEAPGYYLNKTIDELTAEGSIVLTGESVAVSEVKSQQDEFGNAEPVVALEFNEEGKAAFADATTEAYGNGKKDTIGIYYDGRFISVPAVQAPLTDGKAVITGEKSFESAKELASMIRIGGLKLQLNELRSNVVGAQLGSDAIRTSLIAAAVGFALIALFMIVIFRILGLSATLALGFYCGLIVFLLSAFDITLTLPGIAGIILSIGMAVDANVLVFSRIREEIASGKAVDEARKNGYHKALSSILDGNITTLIVALVLRAGGTGPIKGFAETLMLGIILSMFTALVVTRVITSIFYGLGLQSPVLYGKAKPVKEFDFIGKRKLFYAISALVIAVGIIFMAVNSSQGKGAFNYSLDFVGGTSTTVTFDKEYTVSEIENDMIPAIKEATGIKEVLHQRVSGTNQVIFKSATMDVAQREAVEKIFEEKYGISADNIAAETISSTISSEMRGDAVKSLLIALILMLIYIWFRFKDFRFSASAILALVHDVLIVLASYAIVRVAVGNTFIAVMLTIVGYSINATIVIFDRIRENLNAPGRLSVEEIVNTSITQTLSRSIFTSLTTFIMVAVLYILGVTSIKEFALPLMVGIACGTFSSVCLTGAFWFLMRKVGKKKA